MVWRHRGVDIPPQVYHSVPRGWHADEIADLHKSMRGSYPISEFEIGKWGAPSWMTERYEWLRYKAILTRVAAGIRAGDDACIELGVRYIQLRFIGSYSGYIRGKIARALKHACLTEAQKRRLNDHFLGLVIEQDYTGEMRDYIKFWGNIITKAALDRITSHFGHQKEPVASWVADLNSAYQHRGAKKA